MCGPTWVLYFSWDVFVSCSVAKFSLTLCYSRNCSMPGSPVLHSLSNLSLLKFMPIESVMPFNYLILCHPVLLLPSILPSISVFSYELAHRIRWSKYWRFTFSISPSNEYSGLLSFRNNWFDPLDVQATVKSLLQRHSSETSILRCSTFFMVPLLSWCAVTQLKVKIQVLSQAIYLFILYCSGFCHTLTFFRMDYIGWWAFRL